MSTANTTVLECCFAAYFNEGLSNDNLDFFSTEIQTLKCEVGKMYILKYRRGQMQFWTKARYNSTNHEFNTECLKVKLLISVSVGQTTC